MIARMLPFSTLLVTALNAGLTLSHLLEMPAKRRFDAQSYLRTQQIYRTFGPIGGLMEPGSVVAAAGLAYRLRGRGSAFRLALLGAGFLATSLVAWLALVAPVNAKLDTWSPDAIPSDWQRTRDQWEYAHAGRAVLQIAGLASLILSALAASRPRTLAERVRGLVAR